MDIIIYFGVVILSFYIGRCSGLDDKEHRKAMRNLKNKIGCNPSPDFPKTRRQVGGYQPSTLSAEQLKNIKPPKTGSGIKPTPPPYKTVKGM